MADLKNRIKCIIKPQKITAFIIGFFVAALPQFIWWKVMFGKFLVRSYGSEETFLWLKPRILEVLFSISKGMLFWSPVLILSFVGLWFCKKKLSGFFYGTIIVLAMQMYTTSSWYTWDYGASFGHRAFVDMYVLYGLLMAISINVLRNSYLPLVEKYNDDGYIKSKEKLIPLINFIYPLLVLWCLFEIKAMLAYWYGIIPDSEVTLEIISNMLNWVP